MDVLVIGSNGQLGNELRALLETGRAEIGPIPCEYAHAQAIYADCDTLDITDRAAVDAFFSAHCFDVVFNCAAFTNVDGCENDETSAFAVNALGAENIARACGAAGAKLVHVSTDYVFPGNDPTPRCEDDPTGPLSAYGRTKLAGEERVLAACPRAFVVRTAWLYGREGRNFVKTMLSLGRTHEYVTVVDDQLGNPTSANDLAYELLKIALTNECGVWHCTNEGICSWADFAEAIMRGAGLSCEVRRCTSDEYAAAHPASARRPAFSALENARLSATIGNEMRPWQDALASYLELCQF